MLVWFVSWPAQQSLFRQGIGASVLGLLWMLFVLPESLEEKNRVPFVRSKVLPVRTVSILGRSSLFRR